VKPGRHFFYFDPLESLSAEVQQRWRIAGERDSMIRAALEGAGRTA
jgi:hypothetical protein